MESEKTLFLNLTLVEGS